MPEKEPFEKIRKNNPQYHTGAGNRFPLARVSNLIIHRTLGTVLRRGLPQEWGKVALN